MELAWAAFIGVLYVILYLLVRLLLDLIWFVFSLYVEERRKR